MRVLSTMLFLAMFASGPAHPEQITVAAAADLTFAFPEVAARFYKETGNTVNLSFGSSGNFFSQIENGAPYDLFFSADIDYPKKLGAAGLIEPGSLYPYAVGRIVLWAPKDFPLDLNRGLDVLLDPRVRKIAIANPEHAPYGRAAVAAMQHDGVYEKVRDKMVLGESIAQAAQFVVSGNADVGILALSLALGHTLRDQGKYFEIPPSSYPAIIQAGVILKSSTKKQVARQFLEFLRKPETREIMRHYGFVAPASDSPPARRD